MMRRAYARACICRWKLHSWIQNPGACPLTTQDQEPIMGYAMLSRAEFLFLHQLPALLRRRWSDILAAKAAEGAAVVAEREELYQSASTEPWVYYDRTRKYRRWYYKEKHGGDTPRNRQLCCIFKGPMRLMEEEAIEDARDGMDAEKWKAACPFVGVSHMLAYMLVDLRYPSVDIGDRLLREYERYTSTRVKCLQPVWVWADTIRKCPPGRLRTALIRKLYFRVGRLFNRRRLDRDP